MYYLIKHIIILTRLFHNPQIEIIFPNSPRKTCRNYAFLSNLMINVDCQTGVTCLTPKKIKVLESEMDGMQCYDNC